jgi:hypothetical protein
MKTYLSHLREANFLPYKKDPAHKIINFKLSIVDDAGILFEAPNALHNI